MNKILIKSAFSFAGLVVVSWLLLLLDKIVLAWETSGTVGLITLTLLPYVYWFLLTAVYALILFILFLREKRCCLIIALNGLFVLMLFFALWLARVPSGLLDLVTQMMQSGSVAVMALALVFRILISGNGQTAEKVPGRTGNVFRILLETILGLGLFAILAFETYALTRISAGAMLAPFLSVRFVWLMAAVIYASVLYMLFRSHLHAMPIMIINAVLIAAVWYLIFVPGALLSMSALFPEFKFFLCSLAGNTAILTVALAVVFKLAERIYSAYRAAYRKSYAQHKMDDIGTII